MQAAVETAVGILHIDFAAVYELLPSADALELRASFGWEEELEGLVVPSRPDTLAGFTLAENAPVLVEDLPGERRFIPPERLVRSGIQSGITVPLRGVPLPFGVFGVYSLQPRSFDADDVTLLRSASNVLAAALARVSAEDSLRQVNSLLHGVVEGSADAVFVTDASGRYRLINGALARVVGKEPDEVVGLTAKDLFPAEVAEAMERHDGQVIAERTPLTFEETLPLDGEERVFLAAKSPYFDRDGRVAGVIGIARDITERKRAEERQRFLAQGSAVLDTSLDPGETLHTIANVAVPEVADLCVIDLLQGDGALHGVAVASPSSRVARRLEKLRDRFPLDPQGDHPVARVLREGKARLFPELELMYADIAQSDEHLAFAREVGYRSAVVAPLRARGRTLGAISLIRYETQDRYTEDELELALDLARRAATALDNARLYTHQHEVAATLQRSLLPESFPEIPGLEFAARYVPGGPGVDVGGDWYDVLPLPRGKVGLVIGDVAGRGLHAASVMGQLRTTLRVFGDDHAAPGAALTRADRIFQRFDEGQLATLLFLTLDPVSGKLTYSAAAHPPPLVVTQDARAYFLEGARGLPMGVVPAAQFPEAAGRLDPGSTLLLYTDGLVERPGESIDEGLERLRGVVGQAPTDPELLVDHTLEGMLDQADRTDDVAVLAVHLAMLSPELEVKLSGAPGGLSTLREEVRVWLGRQRVAETVAEDVTLACSEAAANAMEHAYGSVDGPVEVHGRRDGDRLLIRVSDFGQWRLPRDGERGRGLGVIDALMDRVDIVKRSDGTDVRMVRLLGDGSS